MNTPGRQMTEEEIAEWQKVFSDMEESINELLEGGKKKTK